MVIISNGFSQFHLSAAAAEAARRKLLSSYVTGAYPVPLVKKVLSLPYLRTSPKAQRLAARYQPIANDLVHPLFASEALYELERHIRREAAIVDSMRLYGWSAIRFVKKAAAEGARIYHYRSGFGGASIEVARKLGMFLLCDHSIAHPATVKGLVDNMGKMPTRDDALEMDFFWKHILRDVESADAVLVNSHFVEDTFGDATRRLAPIHVIYLGVDDSFLSQVPRRQNVSGPLSLLFAGSFDKRKGAEILIETLGSLDQIPWQLEIAGSIDSGIARRYQQFFSDPRVKCLGLLSRRDLATVMSKAEVFVFPSFAEGSARVVFEALACGCYVITTPNSGSITENGVHGSVVPPGDSPSLARAIEHAYHNREEVSKIGFSNAEVVRERFTQNEYGNQLSMLYEKCLGMR